MRIDRVKYTAHYDEFGVLKDQWIGLEGQIDDTEVPEKKLDEIKGITEEWYKKQNPQLQQSSIQYAPQSSVFPVIQSTQEDREIEVRPEDILSSPDLKVLETYRWIIKGKPELERAYMLRHDQLSGK